MATQSEIDVIIERLDSATSLAAGLKLDLLYNLLKMAVLEAFKQYDAAEPQALNVAAEPQALSDEVDKYILEEEPAG